MSSTGAKISPIPCRIRNSVGWGGKTRKGFIGQRCAGGGGSSLCRTWCGRVWILTGRCAHNVVSRPISVAMGITRSAYDQTIQSDISTFTQKNRSFFDPLQIVKIQQQIQYINKISLLPPFFNNDSYRTDFPLINSSFQKFQKMKIHRFVYRFVFLTAHDLKINQKFHSKFLRRRSIPYCTSTYIFRVTTLKLICSKISFETRRSHR